LHIFDDTTLEDEHTYEYVYRFQEENPLIPFFNARAELVGGELVIGRSPVGGALVRVSVPMTANGRPRAVPLDA
jgi:hypothetical protein